MAQLCYCKLFLQLGHRECSLLSLMVGKGCLMNHSVFQGNGERYSSRQNQIMKGLDIIHTEFKLDSEDSEETLKDSKQEVSNVGT